MTRKTTPCPCRSMLALRERAEQALVAYVGAIDRVRAGLGEIGIISGK